MLWLYKCSLSDHDLMVYFESKLRIRSQQKQVLILFSGSAVFERGWTLAVRIDDKEQMSNNRFTKTSAPTLITSER